MGKSTSEFNLEHTIEKIEKVEKQLVEHDRVVERTEKEKLWEADKINREYTTRLTRLKDAKELLVKDLANLQSQKKRLEDRVEKESQDEEQRRADDEYHHRKY